MQTENNRIQILFSKYLQNSISSEELSEFWQLLPSQSSENLTTQLQTLWLKSEDAAPVYSDEEWKHKLKTLIDKAEQEDAAWTKFRDRNVRRMPTWIKWATAACIILVTGYGLWVMREKSQVTSDKSHIATTHDVPAPTNTRAVITLANGSKVYLDSAGNGTIAQENNVNVVKNTNGGIQYLSSSGGPNSQQLTANSLAYNTLFNPRGSKVISLTLSDGTRVWLNSESSLKYPIAFNSSNREVEITGEAYFEVKHNAKQPFKVHLPNGSVVEDIGTAFNVNAYSDETDIKTTLIEGSVKVVQARGPATRDPRETLGADRGVVLKPGQQAVLNQVNPKISRIEVQTNVDLDKIIAWKDGWFEFTNTNLAAIMRQLSRWYDLDVHYEGTPTDETFAGRISKNLPLSNVLHLLESNGVKFKIEDKRVTVLK